jgi:flagellar hook-associated protein 2
VTSLVTAQSGTIGIPSGTPYSAPKDYTLNIQLGTRVSDIGGDTFTAGTASAVPIAVKAGQSLTDIAASINKDSTSGVVATVINTASGQQLALRGNTSGANAGFRITSTDDTNTFADGLMKEALKTGSVPFNPPQYESAGTWATAQYAVDARVKIDGIEITSSTNTIKDAVPGVTLNLLSKTTTAAQISVDVDRTSIKAKIQTFQDAYNKINADLKAQTKYDASTKTAAPLLGDGTTTGLQSMLRSLVGATGPVESSIKRLSDLGLEIQSDGALKSNSTKLDAAMQDTANVKAFFAHNSGTAIGNGIAKRIYDFAFGANATGGSVSSHSTAFQKSIDQNAVAIDKFNTHIADYQKQLLAQYTRLDTNMSTLNSLSTFVSQQVAQWNKTS